MYSLVDLFKFCFGLEEGPLCVACDDDSSRIGFCKRMCDPLADPLSATCDHNYFVPSREFSAGWVDGWVRFVMIGGSK